MYFRDSQQLHVEQWKIDGINLPQLLGQTVVPFSPDDTQVDYYSLPCGKNFHSFPLIPQISCVVPPAAISVSPDAAALRIGTKVFGKTANVQDSAYAVMKEGVLNDSWEDIQTVGPFLITSRRRIPREQPTSSKEREENGTREARAWASSLRMWTREERQGDSDEHDSGEYSEDSDDEMESESDSSDESDLETFATTSSAEESWSEGSETEDGSEESSDFEEAEGPESEDSDDDIESEKAKKLVSSGSGIKSFSTGNSDESESDLESTDSLISFDQVADDAFSGTDDSDIQSDTSERSKLDPELLVQEDRLDKEPSYSVGISHALGNKWCDGCSKQDLAKYLHCLVCNDNDFDICFGCERSGRWCLDKKHQMYRTINQKVVGVASRTNFTIQQELNVFRTNSKDAKTRVFRFRRNYNSMLYESRPIIHPKHPLAVWAVTSDRILFANLESNSFFEQKINASSTKGTCIISSSRQASSAKLPPAARPICVDMSFSPCGGFLRVANIDTMVVKVRVGLRKRRRGTPDTTPRMCLNLHIMILKLSKSKPTKIPPKMVATTNFRLGCGIRPHVQVLPFAFTWKADDLYLTISQSRLRVYRFSLPTSTPQPAVLISTTDTTQKPKNEFSVTVPQEVIFLPRSARNRSVHFFPPDAEGGNSVVIIGPRFGRYPAPSIVVYLKDQDLGGWVPVENKEGEVQLHAPMKRLESQFFEQFDEEIDCDIIPFE